MTEKILRKHVHSLGAYKWEKLGMKYPLEGVNPPTDESVQIAEHILKGV